MRRHKLPANEAQVLHDVVRLGGAAQAAARLTQLADVVAGDFPRLPRSMRRVAWQRR